MTKRSHQQKAGSRMQSGVATIGVLLAAACAGTDGGWSGTMTDSAGVVIVQNPAEAEWPGGTAPLVEKELSIGRIDGPVEYQFGQIVAIDVSAEGEIYVLDQQAAQVRVFDANGTYLMSIGQPGGGPGELSPGTMAVLVGAGDSVYVADMMRQRIHRFAPAGGDAGGVELAMADGLPVAWAIAPERRFVTQVRKLAMPGQAAVDGPAAAPQDWILLRDAHGVVTDTLIALESGRTLDFSSGAPRVRLFEPEPLWTLLSDGRLVHARNDGYRLEVLRADGTLERVLTKPFEREAVTDEDRTALLRLMREAMGGQAPPQMIDRFLSTVEFAETYPAFARLLGGPDNTIWVQHVRTAEMAAAEGRAFEPQDIGAPEWDVFDQEGRFLGELTLPERFQPLRIVGDAVYGVQRDELDVQHVVRLRVSGIQG